MQEHGIYFRRFSEVKGQLTDGNGNSIDYHWCDGQFGIRTGVTYEDAMHLLDLLAVRIGPDTVIRPYEEPVAQPTMDTSVGVPENVSVSDAVSENVDVGDANQTGVPMETENVAQIETSTTPTPENSVAEDEVPEKIRGSRQLKRVVRYFVEQEKITDVDEIVSLCEKYKPFIPVLDRATNLRKRVDRIVTLINSATEAA